MDRRKAIWAGGIFAVSLGVAAALGFAFSTLSPQIDCDYAIKLLREPSAGGYTITVLSVEGAFPLEDIRYRLVKLADGTSSIEAEGNLSDALTEGGVVTFHPRDPSDGTIQPGDYMEVSLKGEGTHLMLLTRAGSPLGWTGPCEA